MGWFDDNHWAGEAYDFGRGYMARSAYSDPYGAPRGQKLHQRAVPKRFNRVRDDDYSGYSDYSDYGRLTGGRSLATGKFFFGTRKCSICSLLKVEADFDIEEADASAANRCCLLCGRAIVQAIQALEARTPSDPPAQPAPPAPPAESVEEQATEPLPVPVIIGRTHKVFGPDNSSFVTCPCGCKQSASASIWYQGLKTCEGMTKEVLNTFVLVAIEPKKPLKRPAQSKTKQEAKKSSQAGVPTKELAGKTSAPAPKFAVEDITKELPSHLRAGTGLKATLVNRLATRHGIKFRGCAPTRKATGGAGEKAGNAGGSATGTATPVVNKLKRPADGTDTLADDTSAPETKRQLTGGGAPHLPQQIGPLIGDHIVIEDWWSCPTDSTFGKAIKWVEEKVDAAFESSSAVENACTDHHVEADRLSEAGDSNTSTYSKVSRDSADGDTRCCDCGTHFWCSDDYLGSTPLCEDCRYDGW